MRNMPQDDDVRALLLDADGSLFPSEAPAFEAYDWVAEEKRVVSAHLGRVRRPDPAVLEPLRRAQGRS